MARVVATDYPRLVKEVVLLAAGGLVPMSKETQEAFGRVFNLTLPKEERPAAIQSAFFASGHDPAVWEGGWYFDVAKAQGAATKAGPPVKEWWGGGSTPILVLQGTDDVVAVPENSERLAKEFPSRVRVIQIPNAGHAMLPEQPDLIAAAILNSLR